MVDIRRMGQHHRRQKCVRYRNSRQCNACLRWVIFVTVIWVASSLPSTVAQNRYDPPCQKHDFTWTTRSGQIQECKFVKVISQLDPQGAKYCQNPMAGHSVTNESTLPPPVQNVRTAYYTTYFTTSDPDNASFQGSTWSAINITFQLGMEAAGKVRGILFSMKSLSRNSDDFNLMYCRAYNFVNPLSVDALLDQHNNQLQLFFDCFRGQKPGMEYEYTITTLPVLDTSQAEVPNDHTVVRFRYRAPSCFLVPDDFLCKKNSERPPEIALCSYWRPQYFTVTTDYRRLSVTMEIGPEECHFDTFRVAVHTPSKAGTGTNLWDSDFREVVMANQSQFQTFAYGRNITYVKLDLVGVPIGQRVVTVAAWPTSNTCLETNGQPRPCSITLSSEVPVIENPCRSNPCSSLEVCEPNGDRFRCQCKLGYMRDDPMCIRNPCEPLNGTNEPYNPCGLGSCVVHNDKRDYWCTCSDGLVFVGGTCQADPCKSNPCGHHGSCKHATRSRKTPDRSDTSVQFLCECDFGYYFDKSGLTCQLSAGAVVAVILAGMLSAVLLLLLAWRGRKDPRSFLHKATQCFRKGNNHERYIVDQASIPSQTPSVDSLSTPGVFHQVMERTEIIQPLTRVRTVLFYSVDHILHEEVVQRFAAFLQYNCMCDVVLPSWCTQDIARRGVNEWITFILNRTDKVILLCSKGSRVAWHSHANSDLSPDDLFTRAVSIILSDNNSISLSDKYCVAYMDYSSRDDIPPPLAVGAVYRLMKHMDALFFRLHGMKQVSPSSKRRAHQLEEANYATATLQGAALARAIQQIENFQREEPNWFERFNNGMPSRPELCSIMAQSASEVDEDEFESAMQEFLNTTV